MEFTELFHLIISTAVFSGIHWLISLNYFTELFHWIISPNYFTELFQYQLTKTINHRKKVEFMYFSALPSRVQFWNEKLFQNQQVSQKEGFRISSFDKLFPVSFYRNHATFYRFSLTVIFSYFDWIIVGIKISHTVPASYLVIHTYL